MRHVLMTGDAVGGVWTYSLDLARGLRAAGTQVTLAVLGPAPGVLQAAEARGLVDIIPTGLPLDWTAADEGELRSAGAVLAGLAARVRTDLVHLHTPALAAEVPWSVPVVAVAHSDVGTWWQAVEGRRMPGDIAWRSHAVARGLAEADAVIAPSRAFADELTRLYRPGRPIEVVYNGRSPMVLPPSARARRVAAAGRLWDPGKNVALLDQAAQSLDAEVVAAGPLAGPNGTASAFSHIETPGVLGPAAMAAHLAQSRVFVSCARYEPFGLAVLEAAQAGLALALSNIPTHRELWDGAALFFHPDDPRGLADVLRRLLDTPGSAASRAMARAARYTPAFMVEATRAVHAGAGQRRAA